MAKSSRVWRRAAGYGEEQRDMAIPGYIPQESNKSSRRCRHVLSTLPTQPPLNPQAIPHLHLINPNLDLALLRMPPLMFQARVHRPLQQPLLLLRRAQLPLLHIDDNADVPVLVRFLWIHEVASTPVEYVVYDLCGGALGGGDSGPEGVVEPFCGAAGGAGGVDVVGCVHGGGAWLAGVGGRGVGV